MSYDMSWTLAFSQVRKYGSNKIYYLRLRKNLMEKSLLKESSKVYCNFFGSRSFLAKNYFYVVVLRITKLFNLEFNNIGLVFSDSDCKATNICVIMHDFLFPVGV